VDRTSKQPAEIRLGNLDMSLTGFGPKETAGIQLAANLLNAGGQNVLLEGSVGPINSVEKWNEVPLDLQSEIKSLPLAQLIQAVPMLKEFIPSYLDVRGPLRLKAKIVGTIDRPRVKDFALAGAFFGSTSDNVTLKADLDFSGNGAQAGPVVKGEMTVRPVALDRLRKIPFVEGILPASFKSQGPLSLTSKIEGTLQRLKVRIKITADESEIHYAHWLKKPKGIPAELQIGIVRKNNGLVLEKSTLSMHNLKAQFSGTIEEKPERRLDLRLRSASVDLTGWDKLLPPVSPYNLRGKLGFDLSIHKSFAPQGGKLDIRGNLDLKGIGARGKKTGQFLEGVTSKITFHGKEAEVEKLQLRLGSSQLNLQGKISDLKNPTVRYTLRSPRLNLADLTNKPEHREDWVKDLVGAGEFQAKNGNSSARARVSSGAGMFQKIAYKRLKGELHWRNDRVDIKSMTFQALGGSFKGSGQWERETDKKIRFTLRPQIDSMDLKSLLAHLSPDFSKRVDGVLSFKGKLSGSGPDWAAIKRTARGEGRALVERGTLKDFNLVQGVLSRVTGLPGIGNMIATRLSPRYAEIFKRKDTPFETLAASIRLGGQRLITDNMLLATHDYKIEGKGWVDFEKTVNWKAVLAMSSRFTKELTQKHKNVRYLVDDQGRLGVPFVLEGTLPNVQPRPDIRLLSRNLQRGLLRRGVEKVLGNKKSDKKSKGREWILKGLEQLLGK
jgi:hypothetical protein